MAAKGHRIETQMCVCSYCKRTVFANTHIFQMFLSVAFSLVTLGYFYSTFAKEITATDSNAFETKESNQISILFIYKNKKFCKAPNDEAQSHQLIESFKSLPVVRKLKEVDNLKKC